MDNERPKRPWSPGDEIKTLRIHRSNWCRGQLKRGHRRCVLGALCEGYGVQDFRVEGSQRIAESPWALKPKERVKLPEWLLEADVDIAEANDYDGLGDELAHVLKKYGGVELIVLEG